VASSNSDPGAPWRRWRAGFAALLVLVAVAPALWAEPGEGLPGWQWHWVTNRDGVPPLVRAIAQTPDGTLWIGSYYGIHRFDGVHIQPVSPSSEAPRQSIDVAALLAGGDGRLWVGHDWGGLSVMQGTRHTIVEQPYLATVPLLRANAAGITWAVASNGKGVNLARLIGGRWVIWARQPMGFMMDAAVARDGSLWFILDNRLLWAAAGSHAISLVLPRLATGGTLALDGGGQPWLITRGGLYRLVPPTAGRGPALGPLLAKPMAPRLGTAIFDGTSDLWVIEDDTWLARYHIEGQGRALRATGRWHSPFPLSNSSFVLSQTPMFIDREDNLWIGTGRGLLRFSHAAFTTVTSPVTSSALGAVPYGTLVDGRGDLWLWRERALSSIGADGSPRAHRLPPAARPFAPCPGFRGGVWVPRDDHTMMLIGGPAPRTIPLAGGHALSRLIPGDCAEDSRGRLWIDQADNGLNLLGPGPHGKVPLGEDSAYPVLNMVAMENGRMAAYVGHGSLWLTDGTHSTRLWDDKAITLGSIEVMVRAGGQLLLGGDRGLARYDGHRFATLSSQRFPFLANTTGIATTRQGETWLQTSRGVIRLRSADLARAFDDPALGLTPQTFTMSDGLPGTAALFNLSNVNADPQGRIWVTTDSGIARHDPDQAWRLPSPPVAITGLSAGNATYAPAPRVILPPASGRVRVAFTALSFANPDLVRFRYRMQGVDPDWIEAGGERSASYTDLPPGPHRFEVIAANGEGVWNRQGAAIELVQRPTLGQTWWFRAACLAAGLALLWGLYRWRMQAAQRHMREQAAQRAQERERVARDIHDTLLQSIQGLVLRVQAVALKMARDDANRALLETTLDRADELIAQGKERVLGLRDDDRPATLPDLLGQQLEEAPFPVEVERVLTLQGQGAPLRSSATAEIREIVGEALFNAARHAGATRVTVDVTYAARALDVVVQDNGVGLPRHDAGKEPQGFGLVGMRGRARSIGAALTIGTGPGGGGTRIHLRVPATRAYAVVPLWRRAMAWRG
jgi:signal transduction histidine kinase